MNLDERLQKDLSPDIYCLVHNKIINLEQQVKKQKEVIDEIKNELIENEVLDDLPFDVSERICGLFEEVSK